MNHVIPMSDGVGVQLIYLGPDKPQASIAIMPGVGYPKEYYLNFAKYLAEQGFAVAIPDYRGQGASKPESMRHYKIHMLDWAEQDMCEVINWLEAKNPSLPILLVSHSVGGQLMGLLPNYNKIKAAVFVGVGGGYWPWTKGRAKRIGLFLWYFFVPFSNFLFGYSRGTLIPGLVDLPKGISSDWRKWCCSPHYLFDYLGKDLPKGNYESMILPILNCRALDDEITTEKNSSMFMSYLPNAAIKNVVLDSGGHDRMFKTQYADSFWPTVMDWFYQHVK